MQDYLEKPKKKKKREKDDQILKAKPTRNFKIIDDDININDLEANEESEILVDLLDPEGPIIAEGVVPVEKPVEKKGSFLKDKWVTLNFSENDDSNPTNDSKEIETKSLFKKRGEKITSKTVEMQQKENDIDLDYIPRKSRRSDDDLSPVRRKSKAKNDEDSDLDTVPRRRQIKEEKSDDFSPVRKSTKSIHRNEEDDLDLIPRKNIKKEKCLSPVSKKEKIKNDDSNVLNMERKQHAALSYSKQEDYIDETKVRVGKLTKEEELKKEKAQELKSKYADWGRGLVQKREQEEKVKDFLHEAEKPLARYADDKDLDSLLKNQEREEDPMLEYIRKNRPNEEGSSDKTNKKPVPKYRGPPAPPNRYNILPGSKWDGVDRSNGFEKKYFESITAKKAFEQEAYKWSVEDM